MVANTRKTGLALFRLSLSIFRRERGSSRSAFPCQFFVGNAVYLKTLIVYTLFEVIVYFFIFQTLLL